MKQYYERMTAAALALLVSGALAQAQIPDGYYATLKGKSGAELKTAVYDVIKTAKVLEYGSGAGKTWEGFYTTDQADDGMVIDRYSNDERYFGAKGASVSGMNIEHSFPKSWWGGSTIQAYKDLYNLMPCEEKINSSKSNYPMGKVETVTKDNGCTKIGTGSQGYKLWEPADKWKGDFARGYMYMATAYQNLTWTGTQALQILEQGSYPTLQQWAYTLYMEWARADIVDEQEVKRNNEVCKIQGNRNPFVDFPNLMEYIWGDSVDYAFDPENTLRTEEYNNNGGTPEPDPAGTVVYEALFTESGGDCMVITKTAPTNDFVVWKRTDTYGWQGSGYANGTNNTTDASLTTPQIDLTEYGGATMEFEHAVNFSSDPSATLSVEVACDGEITTLSGFVWPTGNSWTFIESGDIGLDEFAGKKINIRFHYRSSDTETTTWEIRSIKVSGQKEPSAISTPSADSTAPDLSKPHEAYSIDGRRVDSTTHKGLMIIKQGGRTWKVVR